MEIVNFKENCELCKENHHVKKCPLYDEFVEYNKNNTIYTDEEKSELQFGVFIGFVSIILGIYFFFDKSVIEAVFMISRDFIYILIEAISMMIKFVFLIFGEELEVATFEDYGDGFVLGFGLHLVYVITCFIIGDLLLIATLREWYLIKKEKNIDKIENYFTKP